MTWGTRSGRATIPPLPRRRVLRVGGPISISTARSSASAARCRSIASRRPTPIGAVARARDYDLVVFDGVTPSAAPNPGRYLYFDPQGPGSPFAAAREARPVRAPVLDPASLRRDYPLLRQLDSADVNVAEAHRLMLGARGLRAGRLVRPPVDCCGERPGLRIAALAFDPRRSDLPMRPAFPLLVANALAWATRDDAGRRARRRPRGTVRDARESDTTPVRTLALGGRVLAPPDPPARQLPRDRAAGR